MSRISEDGLWPMDDWGDFRDWITHSFEALDVGDIFEIGPAGEFVYFDDTGGQVVPNIQIVGLRDGVRLLRLSTAPLRDPVLSSFSVRGIEFWQRGADGPDTVGGYMVSADYELLAGASIQWFRDRWELQFNELGCELHGSEMDPGPAGGRSGTRPPLHSA